VTEATIKFMVPQTRARRRLRNALLRLSPALKPLRRHVNAGRMAEPFTYSESPIVDPSGGHPLVGSFAPDLAVSVDGWRTRLRRLLGKQFVVLCFAADLEAAERFAEQLDLRDAPVPVRVVIVPPAGVDVPEWAVRDAVVAQDEDPEQSTLYRTEATTWYLVRPDGHIAAARGAEQAASLTELLTKCARAARSGAQRDRGARSELVRAGR
jgi:hypothetical protein